MSFNILVLEDKAERNAVFARHLQPKHNLYITDKVEDCISQLKNNRWDILFLDHDLGGEEMVPSGPGTGYEVAVWLERNPIYQPHNIIIHSLNPVGGPKMKEALPKAHYVPGAWLKLPSLFGEEL